VQDELTYKLLKLIQKSPQLSQREMAEHLGISLGKTNATIKSLIDKGLITIQEVIRQGPKVPFIYNLTPLGIRELPRIAAWYLAQKENQIKELQQEVQEIRKMNETRESKGKNNRE